MGEVLRVLTFDGKLIKVMDVQGTKLRWDTHSFLDVGGY